MVQRINEISRNTGHRSGIPLPTRFDRALQEEQEEEGGDDDRDNDDSAEDDTDEENEDDDDDDEEEEPPYTVEEIADTFTNFYEFLTTLHFDKSDLLIPPSSGWPHIAGAGSNSQTKSALVEAVLKHLPCFRSTARAQIHYKSRVVDHSTLLTTRTGLEEWEDELLADMSANVYNGDVGIEDMLIIAHGHESGGRTLILVPKTGEIIEEMLEWNTLGPFDLVGYFDDLKEQFREMKLIGGVDKDVIEAENVPEAMGKVDVSVPPELDPEGHNLWATDVNVQFVRQVFREHGWPDSFDRDAAMQEVNIWLDRLKADDRDIWQGEM